jgi:hypothetical protein
MTLSRNARDWCKKLPLSSVDKFERLGREFLVQFMAARTRKKHLGYLLTLQQCGNKSIKEFMAPFNLEKMAMEDPTDDMVFAALYQGLSLEGPLMKKLARKQPSTLQGLLEKVEEFINQEETLKAISLRQPQDTPLEKKKNELKKLDREEQ